MLVLKFSPWSIFGKKRLDNTKFKYMKKILVNIKKWFVNLLKGLWNLNWEAKLGLLLLVPPTLAAIRYIERGILYSSEISILEYPINSLQKVSIESGIGMEPIFYGLLALAGAYLIKGSSQNK